MRHDRHDARHDRHDARHDAKRYDKETMSHYKYDRHEDGRLTDEQRGMATLGGVIIAFVAVMLLAASCGVNEPSPKERQRLHDAQIDRTIQHMIDSDPAPKYPL